MHSVARIVDRRVGRIGIMIGIGVLLHMLLVRPVVGLPIFFTANQVIRVFVSAALSSRAWPASLCPFKSFSGASPGLFS